jgi:hypothetical protein
MAPGLEAWTLTSALYAVPEIEPRLSSYFSSKYQKPLRINREEVQVAHIDERCRTWKVKTP